ncbi:MAG: hypothetical protein ACRDRI_18155 [Pseudonocardiaceae bacterium]
MSGDGHILRVTELGRLSRTLAEGASNLNGLAADAPRIPDAGQSTAAVAAMVSTITSMVSRIVETAAVASDQAIASDNTYQQTDQHNAGDLSRGGRG